MFLFSRPFLYEETAAGERIVSWRAWLLIWLVPGMFALAALALAGETGWRLSRAVAGEGAVVRVYAYEGETLFDRGRMNYAPVFRYEFRPGEMTEASTGMSAPGWNFQPGERRRILYDPKVRRDVMLPGWHNWAVAGVIAAIALITALPAFWGHRRVRRWQRADRGAV